nr:putative glycosyltransferase [Quercus suber]POF10008.1 putative glycosyltransferase [Quercus suber]
MVKRFKVWTYNEGEQPLVHDGPLNHVYSLEGQFIDEIEWDKSPFRASHPEEAHAPDVSDVNPQLFKNFMKVLCNANTSEGFRPSRDVSIPEMYLRFGTLGPPHQGQSPNNHPILAFFGGREHGQIRKILLKHWKDKDSDVQVHEYLPKGRNYTKVMGQAEYCLCPSGFEVASPRIVEAIYMGCVPVIISGMCKDILC